MSQFPAGRSALSLAAVLLAVLTAVLVSTPAGVARADDDPPPTQTKFFVPWLPNGTLNPSITVTARETLMGNPNLPSDCQAGSISTQRPDAWRCVTADPCFSPTPFSATEVACATAPWANEVVLLTLSRPLPSPGQCSATPTDCPRQLDLNSPPWAVELANGARCRIFTGTISSLGGLALLYGCEDGGLVGVADRDAPFDTTLPQWRAFYLPKDGTVIEQVGVLTVWR
jgi:hypothetical protein